MIEILCGLLLLVMEKLWNLKSNIYILNGICVEVLVAGSRICCSVHVMPYRNIL
jgi:hypothetical protein